MTDIGSLYRITYTVYNDTGTKVNAQTCVLTIYLPDGTALNNVSMTNDATGEYHYDYLTADVGRHTGAIHTTLPNTARGFSFNVDPIQSSTIVSLADQKKYLGMSLSRTTSDDELLSFMMVATEIVESKVGVVAIKTVVGEYQPTGYSLWLKETPVIGDPTVIDPWLTNGIGYNVALVRTDSESGRVMNLSGEAFLGGPFAVTYKAGRAIVPASVAHASKQVVKHLWETQRGGMSFSGIGTNDDLEMFNIGGREYTVPRRVLEALAPHRQGPRVA